MSVSGDFYRPGTSGKGATLVIEDWNRGIDADVYEGEVFFPKITEVGRLYNKLHLRKLGTFSAQTLASTADGTGLTYGIATESEVQVTPVKNYIAVAMSDSQTEQMDMSPEGDFRTSIQAALGAQIDTNCLADVATLTTITAGDINSNIGRALLLAVLGRLRQSAKSGIVKLGETPLDLILGPLQHDDFLSIPEITSANLRGGNANPNISGIVYDALGVRVSTSGNLTSDASGLHNPLFHKSAFVISWNSRIGVEKQRFEMQNRLYVSANYGHGVKWDGRAASIRTKLT